MKKVPLIITLIVLLFCSACSSNPAISPSEPINSSTVPATAANRSEETTDWKPTAYATVNNLNGVAIAVKEGTVSPTGLSVGLVNHSGSQYIYGEYFCLEKKINGRWHQVPVVINGNYGFNDIAYVLASGDDGHWTVGWDWLYGSLDPGEYRHCQKYSGF